MRFCHQMCLYCMLIAQPVNSPCFALSQSAAGMLEANCGLWFVWKAEERLRREIDLFVHSHSLCNYNYSWISLQSYSIISPHRFPENIMQKQQNWLSFKICSIQPAIHLNLKQLWPLSSPSTNNQKTNWYIARSLHLILVFVCKCKWMEKSQKPLLPEHWLHFTYTLSQRLSVERAVKV